LDKIDSQDVTKDERSAAVADTSTEMQAFLKAVGVYTDTAAASAGVSSTLKASPSSTAAAAKSSTKKLWDCATVEKERQLSQSAVPVDATAARRLSDSVNVAALRRAMLTDSSTNAESIKSTVATGAAAAGACIADHFNHDQCYLYPML
jgi:hypothetical protein